MPVNQSGPFQLWFWQVVFLLDPFTLKELPEIAFESACKEVDPSFDGAYIQEIYGQDDDIILVYKDVHKGTA